MDINHSNFNTKQNRLETDSSISDTKTENSNWNSMNYNEIQTNPHLKPIVGIVISNVGLASLLYFFKNIPTYSALTFIIVTNDDTLKLESLPLILSEITSISVSEVKDNTIIQPNHIYFCSAGKRLTISNSVLTVSSESNKASLHTFIDDFLASLAHFLGNKAIAVLLVENSLDASRGFNEIKAAGGVTFVQKPESSEDISLSLDARATGIIDFVLKPQEIANEILRISQSNSTTCLNTNFDTLFLVECDAFNKIINLLKKTTNINFAEYKQLTIKRRIKRRMILHEIFSLNEYINFLQHNIDELSSLQQDLLINVTKFFREPQSFSTLKNIVFPIICPNTSNNHPLRLWVPGCSTGEEAYSLAICLLEFCEDNNIQRPIQIFATDINATVIDKARIGIYDKNIIADVTSSRLQRFFTEVDHGYQVNKNIRDLCIFAKQDISQDPPISKVDLISCRNVMIYFSQALHTRIFPIFHYALNPTGFLILGASESIGTFADLFELTDKKHRIYTKKSISTPLLLQFYPKEQAASLPVLNKNDQDIILNNTWSNVQKEADRIVLSRYSPPGVIINSKMDIVQFRGRTGDYLEPANGTPSLNLLKMARDGLFAGLRTAVNQAKTELTSVKKEGLLVFKNGHTVSSNIDVIPITGSCRKGEYFLVLFEDVTEPKSNNIIKETFLHNNVFKEEQQATEEILRLNQEMAATKEYLQSIIDQHEASAEDLRHANEEVLSSNEELQSMNEEMETAKEEMQSTNEELMTLNEELRTRNLELNHVNNDMLNLLRSINLPVLILSSDLRIRRFNSAAEKLFNLIETDVGRPINNIKPNITMPDLEQASLEVLDTLQSNEQEVQDRWGYWHFVQIRPYRTTDNKIDGIIITVADIDTIKKSLNASQDARQYAEAIVETVQHPLLILNADLCLKTANKAFYQTFQITPTDNNLNGQSIFKWLEHKCNVPELHHLINDVLTKDTIIENYIINSSFAEGEIKSLLINVRQIITSNTKTKLILMAFSTMPNQRT